jgi:hypothetical protein
MIPSIFKSAILYFVVVFGTGFVLGTIRTLWIVPRLGIRYAELLEGPFMLLAIFVSAGWIVRRLPPSATAWTRLWVGFIALGLSIGSEILMGVFLMGLTVTTVFTHHDPVSGAAFLVLLLVFALMPWFWGNQRRPAAV